MSDPFLGEIELFTFDYPPKGWVVCAGQLLPIEQNKALFELIGTVFGGDGITNFALPDLRGRTAIGQGAGPGLTPRMARAVRSMAISGLPSTSSIHPLMPKASARFGFFLSILIPSSLKNRFSFFQH